MLLKLFWLLGIKMEDYKIRVSILGLNQQQRDAVNEFLPWRSCLQATFCPRQIEVQDVLISTDKILYANKSKLVCCNNFVDTVYANLCTLHKSPFSEAIKVKLIARFPALATSILAHSCTSGFASIYWNIAKWVSKTTIHIEVCHPWSYNPA